MPEAKVAAHSKGEIAFAELDRLRAAGLQFGLVLADAGYGASAAFRHEMDARELFWAVGVPRPLKVYTIGSSCAGPGADGPATQDAGAE